MYKIEGRYNIIRLMGHGYQMTQVMLTTMFLSQYIREYE